MSGLALMEVQRSLYSKLHGDGVLAGMVSGIYDVVPQHSVLPYVILGDSVSKAVAADGTTITECQMELEVWTDTGGRKTALNIMNRIHALLHLGTLSISGLQLILLRVERADTALAEQASRMHGTLRVIATVAE